MILSIRGKKALSCALISCASLLALYVSVQSESILSFLFGSVSYGFFWTALRGVSKKGVFWLSLAFFTLLQLFTLSWMSACEFQGLYMLVLYVLLSLVLGLQFALLSLFVLHSSSFSLLRVVQAGSLWFLLEWSRLFWFCGFTWSYLGEPLANWIYSAQLASKVGILGLSFALVILNVLFFKALQKEKKALWGFFLMGTLIPLYGKAVYAWHDIRIKESKQRAIALVQTAIAPPEKTPLFRYKERFIHPLNQWEKILEILLKEGIEEEELLIFPESTAPFCLDEPLVALDVALTHIQQLLGENIQESLPEHIPPFVVETSLGKRATNAFFAALIANYFKVDLLVSFDEKDPEKSAYYNSAFYCKKGKAPLLVHRKIALLPLAETLPTPGLKEIAKRYGIYEFFTPGRLDPERIAQTKLGVSLCLEDTFSSLAQKQRRMGALLFVNLTNDGWYPHSSLGKSHLRLARLRAIENGTSLVRSTNLGISALIDPLGRIKKKQNAQREEEYVLKGKIPEYVIKTFYTDFGDKPLLSLSLLTLILFIPSLIKNLLSLKLFPNTNKLDNFN